MRRFHTFILKILSDGTETLVLQGQISEPASHDEWRVVFADFNGLFERLSERLGARVVPSPSECPLDSPESPSPESDA